ncbi:unnamed protein product [Leptidea sinapis]|uniref:Uncharacterized protein n=1 Tax=Leptidea sinapis TaxID=189913 RepID=A0A5E4QR36_9NEOP|nr:unnamed protein product [Leptidea sinapis]
MLLLVFVVLVKSCLCYSDDDLGYGLSIGNSIDVFANYGDLSQVTQVVSSDYEDEVSEPIEPFREKNIRVFDSIVVRETSGDKQVDMNIQLLQT